MGSYLHDDRGLLATGAALLAVLLLAAPRLVQGCRRAAGVAIAPPRYDALLFGLSDQELCRLWRSSFSQLQERDGAEELLSLVELRHACLDELERRHPSTFDAWLTSASRASGGAERCLAPRC